MIRGFVLKVFRSNNLCAKAYTAHFTTLHSLRLTFFHTFSYFRSRSNAYTHIKRTRIHAQGNVQWIKWWKKDATIGGIWWKVRHTNRERRGSGKRKKNVCKQIHIKYVYALFFFSVGLVFFRKFSIVVMIVVVVVTVLCECTWVFVCAQLVYI